MSMTLSSDDVRWRGLTKVEGRRVRAFQEWIDLESRWGRNLGDLLHQIAVDRILLAEEFLAMGDAMYRSRKDLSRSSISRYYYAIYHGLRAVAFHAAEGDDNQDHSKLGKGIPADFPDRALVVNRLNDARIWRNEADYDPYPQFGNYFTSTEKALRPVAHDTVAQARDYLRGKGNPYV